MNTRTLLCGAITAITLSAPLGADVLELDLGRFQFNGGTTDYTYDGDWSSVLGKDVEGTDPEWMRTVATVDLGSLIAAMGGRQIAWISVVDTGENWYGFTPGADMDVFRIEGLADETLVSYTYDGPNGHYAGWDSAKYADRTAVLDQRTGGGDDTPYWVSLGLDGELTMNFDRWPETGTDDSADDASDDASDDPIDDVETDDGGNDAGDGGVIQAPDGLSTAVWIPLPDDRPKDGGILESSWSFTGLELRFNEVSPTAESVNIRIGFAASSFYGGPVPGPGALTVLAAAFRLRRRRR